jgi:DNA-binding LytR/AlgR family response regulator
MLIARETMTNVVEKIPSRQFIRTHRSVIISFSKISSYTNEHLIIDRKVVPISRSYRAPVLALVSKIG